MADKAQVEVMVEEPEVKAVEPKQISLETYCRSVSSRVPPESLSVFYTQQMDKGKSRGTHEEFDKLLKSFMSSPLG